MLSTAQQCRENQRNKFHLLQMLLVPQRNMKNKNLIYKHVISSVHVRCTQTMSLYVRSVFIRVKLSIFIFHPRTISASFPTRPTKQCEFTICRTVTALVMTEQYHQEPYFAGTHTKMPTHIVSRQ